MNAAELVTLTGLGRIDRGVVTDAAVDTALHHNAPVAIGVSGGKDSAQRREQIEARIPGHLLYTAGWPTVMPTPAEADLIAEVRRDISDLLGLNISCVTGASVTARYAELMAAKKARRP